MFIVVCNIIEIESGVTLDIHIIYKFTHPQIYTYIYIYIYTHR